MSSQITGSVSSVQVSLKREIEVHLDQVPDPDNPDNPLNSLEEALPDGTNRQTPLTKLRYQFWKKHGLDIPLPLPVIRLEQPNPGDTNLIWPYLVMLPAENDLDERATLREKGQLEGNTRAGFGVFSAQVNTRLWCRDNIVVGTLQPKEVSQLQAGNIYHALRDLLASQESKDRLAQLEIHRLTCGPTQWRGTDPLEQDLYIDHATMTIGCEAGYNPT